MAYAVIGTLSPEFLVKLACIKRRIRIRMEPASEFQIAWERNTDKRWGTSTATLVNPSAGFECRLNQNTAYIFQKLGFKMLGYDSKPHSTQPTCVNVRTCHTATTTVTVRTVSCCVRQLNSLPD
jgi:hypothetical protein